MATRKRRKTAKKDELRIADAIEHPGALHRQLHVPQGEKIPAGRLRAAAKKSGKLGKRARLAETLESLPHPGRRKKRK